MKFRSLVVGCVAALLVAVAVHAQSSRPEQAPTAPSQTRPQSATAPRPAQPATPTVSRASATPAAPAAPAISADAQKAFLNQYCMACHSEKAKAAGLDSARRLTMDSLDPTNVDRDREKWELVVRKVRAGQMPPLGMKRPDPADFHSMIASFENELDRTAKPYTPPPSG